MFLRRRLLVTPFTGFTSSPLIFALALGTATSMAQEAEKITAMPLAPENAVQASATPGATVTEPVTSVTRETGISGTAPPAPVAEVKPFATEVVKVVKKHREVGMASFYGMGGRTTSGMHRKDGMTAAHRKLPFGTHVRVRDVKTGREVVVVITDRGPFRKSRVIDLSLIAAKELGIVGRGVAKVEVISE